MKLSNEPTAPGTIDVQGDTSQRLWTARSGNYGASWSTPEELSLSGGKHRSPLWGPALVSNSGRLWLFYSHSFLCHKRKSGWAPGGDVRYITTLDGRTWSAPAVLHQQANASEVPWVTANPPLVMADGSMLLPVWAELPRGTSCASNKTYIDGAAYAMKARLD